MFNISSKIRKIRLLREYTQDYLAECLGISVRTYRGIETGKISPTLDQVVLIAQVLKCTVVDLLHFNLETCQFDVGNAQHVRHFSNQLMSAVLYDREIPTPAKVRFQVILQNLIYRPDA